MAACLLLGAAVVPSSSLASTTFGSDLSKTPVTAIVCAAGNCTAMNTALPAAAPPLTSPVTGTIFRWRIKTAAGSSGSITFRVIAPAGGGMFTGAGTGDTELTPTTATTTTFSTHLPVQAGDYIGIDYPMNQYVYAVAESQTGANDAVFQPPLVDGGSPASPDGNFATDELLVNADVAALPTSSVSVPACSETGQLAATVTSDPDPAVAPKAIHFRIDGGSEQTVATTGKPGTATILVPSGSHTLVYWGEDSVGGLESTHHTATVQVGGCATTTPTGTAPTATLTTPPSFSGVSQSHRRWRSGSKLASFTAGGKPPVGTTFQFVLNEAATVRFAFAELLPGRKVNGKCVAQTARNRKHSACPRSVPRGSLSFSAGAGLHKLFFQGRLTRTRKLNPGTYTLTITASNGAAQRATKMLRPFTIVPP